MPTKFQLLPKDIPERLAQLPEKVGEMDGLIALWLFGSFGRGEATPISDVDLAYLPEERLSGEALERFDTRLYLLIADTLHTEEFSLINLRQAPPHFAWRVLTEGKLLWCRDSDAIAKVAERVFQQAPDERWLRRTGNAVFLEGLAMSDGVVDKERMTDFLRLISEDLQDLQAAARVPMEAYVNDRNRQAIVERRLQTAIESAINIANHIIARLGLRAPQDYADVFRVLNEARILPQELANRMQDMARFRNLLVHLYWTIDHERVYNSLPNRIAFLEQFVRCISEWLRSSS